MGDAGRVLQLLGPSTGGIRRVVAALADGLERQGWTVTTAGPPGVLDGLHRQDAVVDIPTGLSMGALWRARGQLRPLADSVDLVHAHGLKPGWLAASLRPRPRLVVSVHNLVLPEVAGHAAPILRALEGRLPRVADRVIAVSSGVAERFGEAANVVTIPPAADPPVARRSAAEVRAAYGVRPDERLLVTAASLHHQKDLPMLLDAVDRVREEVADVRLLVLGDGPDEAALRARAGNHVIFGGRVASAADELSAADVVVISSRWESGPLVLFEALQLGRPVVTTAVGAASEVVEEGVDGRVVPVGDVESFARAVVDVLAEPVRAPRDTSGRFGVAAMTERTAATYREVLA